MKGKAPKGSMTFMPKEKKAPKSNPKSMTMKKMNPKVTKGKDTMSSDFGLL